jgi:arylsulfatase A-like enzyme
METCRQAGRPFMLNVAPHPPHPPFDETHAPAGYLDLVQGPLGWAPNVPADNPRTEQELRCYLAMTKNLDDNLGRLLDYLDGSGLADDTLLVFTSDHGEMHGSHGRVNKMYPYAESVDIPLIIRWPGRIAAGLRLDALQVPIDHLPTLCGLARLPIPRQADGADLSDLLLGRGTDDRDAVLLANYSSGAEVFQTGTVVPEWRGIRTKQHTYCRWLDGAEELYDNLVDPYQLDNLAAREPGDLLRLRTRLAELLAAAHDDFLPGTAYADWFDDHRNLLRTGLGPVPG